MKISIDMDDTYTKYPDFFEQLKKTLKECGHQVGVLSGRRPETVLGSDWDFIVGGVEIEEYPPFGTDEERSKGKSALMRKYNIDIHFDNTADYFDKDLKVIKI